MLAQRLLIIRCQANICFIKKHVSSKTAWSLLFIVYYIFLAYHYLKKK